VKPDRFFVDAGNEAAYKLGYDDGVQVGELRERLRNTETERDIRQRVWNEAAEKYGEIKQLRKSMKGSKA
jgi:hypothetical protein